MSIEVDVEHGVATVAIARPEKHNALTVDMRIRVAEAFESFAQDSTVRAVVLAGHGPSFCSGADVDLMGGRDIPAGRARMRHLHRMLRAVYHLEKPVVAAVQGAAVGLGWSLALACDFTIAAENARFSQVFSRVGLAPDGGAVYLLMRHLGVARAKELVYSARFVDAREAHALGLVSAVVAAADLAGAAHARAQEFAAAPTFALGMAKRLFAGASAPSFDDFLALELMVQPQLTQTKDHAEGVAAFREKRKPRFEGR